MINFRQRNYQKELIDADDIPFADIAQNLRELNFINTWLGGHSITVGGVKQLASLNERSMICEIGCGGGDNLNAIYKWSKRKNTPIDFIGIDMKSECIEFAKQQYPDLSCQWICSDYQKVEFKEKPSIIFSSLFCHHFSDEQLEQMFYWLKQNSKVGFFINDLQRHWLAYHLIKWLSKFFSRSYLLKNDAPLSVSRGFRKKEIKNLLNKVGIKSFTIKWKWAFRWLIIVRNSK